jgi:hypothetical protein
MTILRASQIFLFLLSICKSSVLSCHINIMPFCMKKCEVALLKLAAPFAPEQWPLTRVQRLFVVSLIEVVS